MKLINYPSEILNKYIDLVNKAKERFYSRRNKLNSLIFAQKELVKQRKSEFLEVKYRHIL